MGLAIGRERASVSGTGHLNDLGDGRRTRQECLRKGGARAIAHVQDSVPVAQSPISPLAPTNDSREKGSTHMGVPGRHGDVGQIEPPRDGNSWHGRRETHGRARELSEKSR